MATLEQSISIAALAHAGQVDKSGEPYILHPLRMMFRASPGDAQIVAMLHDVVEDTPWTIDALREKGFSPNVLEAIEGVTKREGESYAEFVARAAQHPVSREVKLLDLEDNMNLLRLRGPLGEKDLARLAKYHSAWKTLHGGLLRK